MPLLRVEDMRVVLRTSSEELPVVRGVNFSVSAGEVLGIAGESGSGKTISMLALLGLLPRYAHRSGLAELDGMNLLRLSERRMRAVRGKTASIVFQDPSASLHPMLSVGRQMTEHMRRALSLRQRDAATRATALLERVRIPDPERALARHPHEFSGGMRQRIAIAMALACEPRLLIADEPTTALDVTVQAGILRLLRELSLERGLAVIMITHDLGVLAAIADQISVMYAGRIVESGSAADILEKTRHPYTRALLDARPNTRRAATGVAGVAIAGSPPVVGHFPSGCSFHPRCTYARERCGDVEPRPRKLSELHVLECDVDPLSGAQAEIAI